MDNGHTDTETVTDSCNGRLITVTFLAYTYLGINGYTDTQTLDNLSLMVVELLVCEAYVH